jgi:hypothetical protein
MVDYVIANSNASDRAGAEAYQWYADLLKAGQSAYDNAVNNNKDANE